MQVLKAVMPPQGCHNTPAVCGMAPYYSEELIRSLTAQPGWQHL
jgi:hypothetical protein